MVPVGLKSALLPVVAVEVFWLFRRWLVKSLSSNIRMLGGGRGGFGSGC